MNDVRTIAHAGADEPSLIAVRSFYLDVTGGPDTDKAFGPISAPVRIGSALGNEVVLTDSTVSRFHCSIERHERGLQIVDTHSRNGTFVDDVRIERAYLNDGSKIRIGQSVLVMRIVKEPQYVEVTTRDRFGDLLGTSAAMRSLFSTLERLARTDPPVLVEGPTGTGKELVARALHTEGRRKSTPFVVVDCGSIAATLIESELFGHERGAFTGADGERKGAFELGTKGTVFLDEVGELPLELQPKLLRVLERGTIKRLGGTEERTIDVRIIAATHRNLRQMVNDGTFREDLYYRLAVCPITIPSLAERAEDIGLLAQHFFNLAYDGALGDRPAPAIDKASIAFLSGRQWAGNVRELRNLMERVVVLGDPDAIAAGRLIDDLPKLATIDKQATSGPITLEEAKRRAERAYLVGLLARHPNDRAAAAAEADVHAKSLPRLIRRHGLRPNDE